jgi:nucleoside-diphosphate kinase
MEGMTRTLIVCKPDAVRRGLVGEILGRFEKTGIKIIASKVATPDQDFYHKHYETIGTLLTRKNQGIFDNTLKMMMQGPVVAFVLEGVDVIENVRKIVGATEPKSALPGTIRGDFAHTSYGYADNMNIGIENLIHASADEKEGPQEIELWFGENL